MLAAHEDARIVVIGQAPGRRVHESGIPWDDASGKRLRSWMGVADDEFYDPRRIALVPMGFCFPGSGCSGDLPPRPECAPEWHAALLELMPRLELTVLLSRYAHDYYLESQKRATLTETVRAWKDFRPSKIPLPHPSPRNNIWLKKNPWFEEEVLPYVRRRVRAAIR